MCSMHLKTGLCVSVLTSGPCRIISIAQSTRNLCLEDMLCHVHSSTQGVSTLAIISEAAHAAGAERARIRKVVTFTTNAAT